MESRQSQIVLIRMLTSEADHYKPNIYTMMSRYLGFEEATCVVMLTRLCSFFEACLCEANSA
ncbi:unnamed protein product [Dovyalis caffra]|uniref:Uncharacterized protein n=1 Tax=Dovyalis caffra TaxID=77055 RepID=A0AAV1RXL3_9ROSI|nr:unnamed protein product [Dovyalis caffra]